MRVAGGYLFPECAESRATGDVTITNSVFDAAGAAMLVGFMDDSEVLIADNEIYDAGEGIITRDASNTTMAILRNTIDPVEAWGIINVARPDLMGEFPYSVNIRGNRIVGQDFADGIGLLDFGREFTGETSIAMTLPATTSRSTRRSTACLSSRLAAA